MYSSIEEVIDQLNIIIDECKTTHSRNGYFPALYHRVTTEVKKKISENFFDDNERMSRLIVVFGMRYLDAYNNFHNNGSCPVSWKIAFDASQSWRPLVLQHLFL